MFWLCGALDTLIMTSLVDNVVNENVMHVAIIVWGGGPKFFMWEWSILTVVSDRNSQIFLIEVKSVNINNGAYCCRKTMISFSPLKY